MERHGAEAPVVAVPRLPRIVGEGTIALGLELESAEEASALAGEGVETEGSDSGICCRDLRHASRLRALVLDLWQVLLCSLPLLARGGAERHGRRLD